MMTVNCLLACSIKNCWFVYFHRFFVEVAAKEPSKKKSQKNRLKDIEKKAPKDEDELEAYRSDTTEGKIEIDCL